jgi:hypothetical protein
MFQKEPGNVSKHQLPCRYCNRPLWSVCITDPCPSRTKHRQQASEALQTGSARFVVEQQEQQVEAPDSVPAD